MALAVRVTVLDGTATGVGLFSVSVAVAVLGGVVRSICATRATASRMRQLWDGVRRRGLRFSLGYGRDSVWCGERCETAGGDVCGSVTVLEAVIAVVLVLGVWWWILAG